MPVQDQIVVKVLAAVTNEPQTVFEIGKNCRPKKSDTLTVRRALQKLELCGKVNHITVDNLPHRQCDVDCWFLKE
jgi:predicted transcriptional regulator